jgi:hypothetical protein
MLGPVGWVGEPKCRPSATAVRSMLDVKDEETLVVCLLGLDSNGKATS